MARVSFLKSAALMAGLSLVKSEFTIHDPKSLDVSLGASCIEALSASIDCHDYVLNFMEPRYRTSIQDKTLTDSICTSDCSASLKGWFDSVTESCAGKTVRGAIPTKFEGYMWAGLNETCVRDLKTGDYCNDIIHDFTTVPDITQMPNDELCHTCHVERLAMMKASQYSVYDEFYKEQLEFVYDKCDASGSTEILPPIEIPELQPELFCPSEKYYTTQQGDTCESIANATGVSAASLQMGNQELLPDCSDLEEGVTVCVPLGCETFYVRPSDTCTSIEIKLGLIPFGKLKQFNAWLDSACSNLQPATDFYGKVICVSPQGGTWKPETRGSRDIPPPGVIDGYTRNRVLSPNGVQVADGTTRNCGRWHVVEGGDSCVGICLEHSITAGLFRTVNPSLSTDDCTSSLRVGVALCVGPIYSWRSIINTQT